MSSDIIAASPPPQNVSSIGLILDINILITYLLELNKVFDIFFCLKVQVNSLYLDKMLDSVHFLTIIFFLLPTGTHSHLFLSHDAAWVTQQEAAFFP